MRLARIFLPALLLLGSAVLIGDRVSADEVGKQGFISGVGCLTPADVEKVVPIVVASPDMSAVAMEAAKQKIDCGPFSGAVTYKGIAKTFTVGGAEWDVIWFQTGNGTNVYSWKEVPGENT